MHENELIPPNSGPLVPSSLQNDRGSHLDLEQQVDAFGQLRAIWDILLKHQWLILATTLVLTVLVAVYSFKIKPVYQATARIDVEAEVPLLQTLNDLFRAGEADDSFLSTQVAILQSDNLAWETMQQLGLGQLEKSAGPSQPQGQILGTPPAMKNAMVSAFKGPLRVERPKDSRMVLVSYESIDPREAALVVNTLVKNYIENNFRTKYDATRQATGWMEERLDELKLKVEKSQEAMVAYERQNNIVNIGEKQTVVEARFEDMSKDLSQAQSERLTKESLYKMVQSDDAQVDFIEGEGKGNGQGKGQGKGQGNSQGNGQGGLLIGLEEKELELKEEYSEAVAQYGPTYPKALKLQDQIKDLESLLQRERKHMVENIHYDYLAALQREQFLGAAVSKQKAQVDRVNQLLIDHNLLKREFDSNQQLYDSILQHLKDANVSAGLRATNIHFIDEAPVPSYPVRPDRSRNIEFGLMAGLILGIAFALTQEALDNSIKNAQEMEKLTGLPTLAIIPMGQSSVRRRSGQLQGIGGNGVAGYTVEMSVLKKPGAAVSEAFRALRTSVLLSTAERPPKILLITSSQPSEGKTATSLNLAVTLAQKSSRVLLLDSDLRRPGLAKALNLPNTGGLSGILTGAYEFDDALLQKVEGVENLFLLPTGPRPPNPAELLCSMKMEKLIAQLRKEFDHVIIDSPPILPITDATILSSLVDGVIMVVESDATSRAALHRACRVMEQSGGKILGTVFNKVDIRRDGYYGYRYYHGYYSYQYKAYYDHDDDKSAA
jgi:capsular exopolysaccharide synthesis family protein